MRASRATTTKLELNDAGLKSLGWFVGIPPSELPIVFLRRHNKPTPVIQQQLGAFIGHG
jgi:hypothetical protein